MRLPDIRISPFLFPYLAAVWILLPRGACSALILAAALHEIGHLLCLYILGLRPSRLCIQIGGAIIEANCSTLSYGREAWVYIAGPLANLATILPCLLTTSRFAIQLAAASALCADIICSQFCHWMADNYFFVCVHLDYHPHEHIQFVKKAVHCVHPSRFSGQPVCYCVRWHYHLLRPWGQLRSFSGHCSSSSLPFIRKKQRI